MPDNNEEESQPDDNQEEAQDDDNQEEAQADENEEENESDEVNWSADEVLEEIHENPHYDDGTESRTQYQIDRELTWIENKLLLVIQMGIDNGMLTE